jgi:kynureninase
LDSATSYPTVYEPGADWARQQDAADPLRWCRDEFLLPRRPEGTPAVYFCGHSLGLQPRAVRDLLEQELEDWASLGVEGHFHGRQPWYSYHELFRDSGARLVGARPGEVVLMNSLTVNLHLMLTTFFRPSAGRHKILMDGPVFPSDLYAVQSQLRLHGFDPAEALLIVPPQAEEYAEEILDRRGPEIALVLWSGVNYVTGQFFDLQRLTRAARRQGCIVGLDLAHAAGNVPLRLHEWDVDFAVWCSYKYLNGGPGAVGGCFVQEEHGRNLDLPRLAGWWGNDPATRFQMHTQTTFVPRPGADGWQLSNPPILALAPLRASLDLFDRAGLAALRAKSICLTGYLQYLLDRLPPGRFQVLTPRDPAQRGCQLSIQARERPRELLAALQAEGVVCDFREPDVLRVAPVPLYNTFEEVRRFAQGLARQFE